MYEAFYGFNENPFRDIPDPDFFFPGASHLTALSQLEYSLKNRTDFSIITGEAGTGKTVLIRLLLQIYNEDINFGLISAIRPTGNISQWLLAAFNIQTDNDQRSSHQNTLTDFLIGQYASGKRCVLIIDEAQELSAQSLEELRMLSNINADKNQVFQTILMGQTKLRSSLLRSDMQQFAQRVAIDFHLQSLTIEETSSYIQHRCTKAGRDKAIFSNESCQLIFIASQGVPRLINTLCNTALIYGYESGNKIIAGDLTQKMIAEKQLGGLPGLRTTNTASTTKPNNKEAFPCAVIESNNSVFVEKIQALSATLELSIFSETSSVSELLSADALILESNIPAPEAQILLEKWQRPILFLDLTDPNLDRQSFHNKLASLLTTQHLL